MQTTEQINAHLSADITNEQHIYEKDGGQITEEQLEAIRKMIPQGQCGIVKSSLLTKSLNKEAQERLIDAINNPPKPTAELIEMMAMERLQEKPSDLIQT